MSWYSKIYVYVRDYRSKNPIRGACLHVALNAMLLLQLSGLAYGYYVYLFVFLKYYVPSIIQAVVYGCIFHTFLLMFLWSLCMTIFTPVARIPVIYHADEETDKKLKAVTPKTGERYFPDQSDADQIAAQTKILDEFANERCLMFVEVDGHMRLRYCYQCNLVKPDRSHHCSSCGFCVVKFDHHCPWINQCVSVANYKYFLLYLIYGEMLICFGFLTQIQGIITFILLPGEEKLRTWHIFAALIFSLLLHAVFAYYPLGELLKYHVKLLYDNETTCEQAKTPIIRGDNRATYNLGGYLNYRAVFGWGLWAFPVPTPVTDGMHFHIRYSDDHYGEKYEVVPRNEISQEKEAANNNNTKTDEMSRKRGEGDVP